MVKLQGYDLSFFIGQIYFANDGAQLYLILQPLHFTLKRLVDTEKFVSWNSKGMLTERLTTPTSTDNSLSPSIKLFCLIFILFNIISCLMLMFNILFLFCKIAENADPNKYVYTGCGIGFGSRSEFSLPDSSLDKNVILIEVDMSSSVHIDNKKKDTLVLIKVQHKD